MRGLLTRNELLPTVGSDRTMRDWQKKELIAKPKAIDGFGKRLRLYPEIALLQVALVGRRADTDRLRRTVTKRVEGLYGCDAFRECSAALDQHLKSLPVADLQHVFRVLIEHVPDAADALERDVDAVEKKLTEECDLFLQTRLGRVCAEADGLTHVRIGDEVARFDVRHVAGRPQVGDSVRCRSFSTGGLSDRFVLPVAFPAFRDGWRQQASVEVAEAVEAVTHGGELPEMEYVFLYADPDSAPAWAQAATRQLRDAPGQEQWKSWLAGQLADYADRHPSLRVKDEQRAASAVADEVVVGDRWASWQAPDLFA